MKHHILLLCAAIASMTFVGCKVDSRPVAKTTVGEPYDVFIVVDESTWRGDVVASVCSLLEDNIPASKRNEGYYHIVGHASNKTVTDLERKHPNILNIVIEPSTSMAFMSVKSDVYAYPQCVVNLYASSSEALVDYIEKNKDSIREAMESSERQRTINYYRSYANHTMMDLFEEHTGMRMLIPNQYIKARTQSEDLLWLIRDYPKKAQYIFAFESDYASPSDLTAEGIASDIDAQLSIIPGEMFGSYMGVDEQGPLYLREVEINGRKWYEMRGWWEVNGDFMGGVFTSYSTYNINTGKITTLLFAIYAPESPQRNMLREMEHLVYTI